jgi:hypothetical protein
MTFECTISLSPGPAVQADVCLQKTELGLSLSNLMLLLEATNLAVATQMTPQFLSRCATILGGFLSAQQSNV